MKLHNNRKKRDLRLIRGNKSKQKQTNQTKSERNVYNNVKKALCVARVSSVPLSGDVQLCLTCAL